MADTNQLGRIRQHLYILGPCVELAAEARRRRLIDRPQLLIILAGPKVRRSAQVVPQILALLHEPSSLLDWS
ncbi:hypothetical protein C84B14_10412 [Salinisphaera sp. C84B14]